MEIILPKTENRKPKTVFIIPLLMALLVGGCGKPPVLVQQYIFDYPSPVMKGQPATGEAIKVDLFGVAQAFNNTAMVYQPQPFKSDTYNYNRWRVNPGNMVTDYLRRDLRNSGLFKAVFSPQTPGQARYMLEGGVEEFQEIDDPDGWKAALALTVTLLDLLEDEVHQRVVFQKNYQAMEPLMEKTPKGLAEGMSRAMEKLSAQIIADVSRAVKRVGNNLPRWGGRR
jgi:cholesterol transport system auxiliary component